MQSVSGDHCGQKSPRKTNRPVPGVPCPLHAVGGVSSPARSVRHWLGAPFRKRTALLADAPEEIKARLLPALASAMLFRPNDGRWTRKTALFASRFERFSRGIPRLRFTQGLAIAESLKWASTARPAQRSGIGEDLPTMPTCPGLRCLAREHRNQRPWKKKVSRWRVL